MRAVFPNQRPPLLGTHRGCSRKSRLVQRRLACLWAVDDGRGADEALEAAGSGQLSQHTCRFDEVVTVYELVLLPEDADNAGSGMLDEYITAIQQIFNGKLRAQSLFIRSLGRAAYQSNYLVSIGFLESPQHAADQFGRAGHGNDSQVEPVVRGPTARCKFIGQLLVAVAQQKSHFALEQAGVNRV